MVCAILGVSSFSPPILFPFRSFELLLASLCPLLLPWSFYFSPYFLVTQLLLIGVFLSNLNGFPSHVLCVSISLHFLSSCRSSFLVIGCFSSSFFVIFVRCLFLLGSLDLLRLLLQVLCSVLLFVVALSFVRVGVAFVYGCIIVPLHFSVRRCFFFVLLRLLLHFWIFSLL